jgi:putative ATP-dependent endonuclease of the OLD family
MRIRNIKITNFRSIKEVNLDLDIFNIQVGQNNHGKTNYFEAIRWFFNGFSTKESKDDIFRKNATGEVKVEVTFLGLQEAIENMTNAAKKTALRNIFSNGENEIVIRRTTSEDGGKKRKLQKPDGTWHDPIGVDKAWGDLLPKLEYVDTQVRANEINGYTKKSPITDMLSGILGTIIEEDRNYQEFTKKFEELFGSEDSQIKAELDNLGEKIKVYLQKQFPDGTSVEFSIENPVFEDLLKNFSTTIDDGVVTDVNEKGDGMQRALMLSIIQAYADYRRENNISRKFIFLIDEAELHLHPTAQRALKCALHDISTNGEQVLINTHSSVLISDNDDTKVFQVLKRNSITDISIIENKDKPYVIYDLLGGSPSDILLPKNFLIVEGASEGKFLQTIIRRFYPDDMAGLFVLAAEGDTVCQSRSMDAVNRVFLPLRPIYKGKTVVMCDKPNSQQQSDFDNFINSYSLIKDKDYFVLTTESLEEYYPNTWKKTKAEVTEMQEKLEKVPYAEKVASEITEEQFRIEMPIVYNSLIKVKERAFN